MPFRLHPEKGLILQQEIKRFQSKGITYSPRNAQPGDTITLFAAVHQFVFNGSNLPAGMYMYRLQAGTQVKSGRIVLINQ